MNTVKVNTLKSREEIVKLEQLTPDFITTINHEFRTPLTISNTSLDIILDKS